MNALRTCPPDRPASSQIGDSARSSGILPCAFLRWLTAGVIVVACTAPVHAQLPGECSPADHNRNASFTSAVAQALVKGDAKGSASLMREMETGLSDGCRAALDRQQPARVQCTANERKLVLDYYEGMIDAASKTDIQQLFDLFDGMERSLSPRCWLAVNQATDPGIRQACSAGELNTMASFAGPMIRSTRSVLESGDPSEMLQIVQTLQGRLSPHCNRALAHAAQKAPPPAPGSPPRMSSVHDHGNGTYSMDGVGLCTTTECTLF